MPLALRVWSDGRRVRRLRLFEKEAEEEKDEEKEEEEEEELVGVITIRLFRRGLDRPSAGLGRLIL